MKKISLLLSILLMASSVYAVSTIFTFNIVFYNVNHDCSVNAADVTALYNYILNGDETYISTSDVNGDGAVNAGDVTMLYNIILNGTIYNCINDAISLNLNSDSTSYHFLWSNPNDNGYQVENPIYFLVIAIDSTFDNYTTFNSTSENVFVSKETISEWLRTKNLWDDVYDVPQQLILYARVEVLLDNGKSVAISNEISFNHTPELTFESSAPIHLWWLTGSFVATEHWNNIGFPYGCLEMVPMYPVQSAIYNTQGEGILEYYGYFPTGGEFKIIENPGSWEYVIGGGNENGGQVYSSNQPYPDNITITQGGYYKITLNTVDKTMSMTRLSDDQASFSTITMPGDYQGWDATANAMTPLAMNDNHDWFSTLNLDNDYGLKFASGNWDKNWGADMFPYGVGYQDGSNIPAKAGTYYVYFNDLSGDYMFIDEENGLIGNNYLKIKSATDNYFDLTASFEDSDRIKICNISTTIDSQHYLVFNNQKIAISRDGFVSSQELKDAVAVICDRPRTGGVLLSCRVEAKIGNNNIKSNTISIPVRVENYLLKIDGNSEMIAMNPTSYKISTVTVPATSSDILFKIVPESVIGTDDYESNLITSTSNSNDAEMYGTFGFGNSGFLMIPFQENISEYTIEIDLEYKSFSINGVANKSMIWQVGNANDWGNPSQGLSMVEDNGQYMGYMYLSGDFKFRENENSWDGTNWGIGNVAGTLAVNAGNLNAEAGFYKAYVDLDNLTYSLTKYDTIEIIGSATDGDWGYGQPLTYNHNTRAWEGSFALKQGEFKFRANSNWYYNWGGTFDNIIEDGANLSINEAGNYFVQLFLTYPGDSHITLTNQ